MRFAIGVPSDGEFADPARLVDLAVEAEAAGWDGFFLWDHLVRRRPWKAIVDPWVVLAAVAQATERIELGPMVTPIARRRPAKLARETATLDRLSGGRLILGVGLGAPDDEFARFGEDPDPRVRAAKLDEGLELLDRLWTGEPVTHHGTHHVADDVQFRPRPARAPRPPVWVAGGWPTRAPFRRAARWDGVFPIGRDAPRGTMLPSREVAELVAFTRAEREELGLPWDGFDVVVHGISPGDDADACGRLAAEYAGVGVTWWSELLDREGMSLSAARVRVLQGPLPTS